MILGGKSTSSHFSGFLDSETSIVGELQFSGTLRIDGNLHGSIRTSDTLIIGKEATVRADISAGEVQIWGTVLGDVDCEGVEIYGGGRLQGDLPVPSPQIVWCPGR